MKSSGNQAEHALRETARRQELEYPAAAKSIIHDTYMDDVVTGADDVDAAEGLMSDIDSLIAKGGFSGKGMTCSGRPPSPSLSKDGASIMILGSRWFPETDEIQIAFGPINFAKKRRGRRMNSDDSHKVPDKITKEICASKFGELFDVCGLAAPIVAGFKSDMHDIVLSKCD